MFKTLSFKLVLGLLSMNWRHDAHDSASRAHVEACYIIIGAPPLCQGLHWSRWRRRQLRSLELLPDWNSSTEAHIR